MQGFAMPDTIYSLATPAGLDPARVKVLWNMQPGPLTLSQVVNVERNNQLWIVGGSGFTASAGFRGCNFNVDGVQVGAFGVFINPTFTHTSFPVAVFKTAYALGNHTVSITVGTDLQTDSGDRFTVALIELENTQELIRISGFPPVVSSLPSNPEQGQEVYYAPDAFRLWHLKYDAAIADAYKWKFLGGDPKQSVSDSTVRNSSSTSYTFLTGSPRITVPVSGYYKVRFGCGLWSSTAANNVNLATVAGAGVAASDSYAIRSSPGGAADADSQMSIARIHEFLLTAGMDFEMQHRVTGGTLSTLDRWLEIIPSRVG